MINKSNGSYKFILLNYKTSIFTTLFTFNQKRLIDITKYNAFKILKFKNRYSSQMIQQLI